jgi:hypothetical protein
VSKTCGDCVCSAPARPTVQGRLVLATQVDHTATALGVPGAATGTRLRAIAPGLLELYADGAQSFLADARRELSSVEADEVRCMVVERELQDAALLAQAMWAPSLSAAGARVVHADLLPLFDNLQALPDRVSSARAGCSVARCDPTCRPRPRRRPPRRRRSIRPARTPRSPSPRRRPSRPFRACPSCRPTPTRRRRC